MQVTSKKDQEQYWYDQRRPYRYVPVAELANAFRDYRVGKELDEELSTPFDKSRSHPAALVTTKYALPKGKIFKACIEREWLLIKRNRFLYIFRTCQVRTYDSKSGGFLTAWIWLDFPFICFQITWINFSFSKTFGSLFEFLHDKLNWRTCKFCLIKDFCLML